MRLRSFRKLAEEKLGKAEVAEIRKQARLEKKVLETLQKNIATAMEAYMKQHDIGFNELVRKLDVSPTHIAKIQKGDANLTLASIAHLFSLLGQEPQLVFKKIQ